MITPERLEELRREFAEKIIAGEYSGLVVGIIGKDDDTKIDYWYDGSACMAVGLTEVMKNGIMEGIK
jgi:hypothetical protein